MSIKTALTASAIALFSGTGYAHMIMASPPPYGNPSTSPLAADGSDFPCKATAATGGPVTDMTIGSTQTLSFNGTAVHGGGSCQVSLTTDNPATKSSKWMVIHSIMGGCPAKGTPGNFPDPPAGIEPPKFPDPNQYKYTIPQGINPGTYTLAWTWHNKVGNREMYMNCASVKIAGGSGKRDASLNETDYAIPELSERAAATFPSMFVANIPVSDCTTVSSKDVEYPDPGSSVEKAGVASDLTKPTGPKCGSAGTQAAASSGGSSSGAQAPAAGGSSSSGSSSPGAAPAAAPSAAASPAAAAAAPDSASAAPDSASAAAPSAAAAAPAAAAPAAASGAGAVSPSAAPASSGASSNSSAGSPSGSSGSSSCTTPGSMICSPDGKQFAICSATGSPVFQPVAAGTSCKNSAIGMAKMARSPAKYALKFRG